jgi:hypothetical protein
MLKLMPKGQTRMAGLLLPESQPRIPSRLVDHHQPSGFVIPTERSPGDPPAGASRRDHGRSAYSEARQRQRDGVLSDGTTHAGRTPAHWQRVAFIVARMTGIRVGLDTATRMLD